MNRRDQNTDLQNAERFVEQHGSIIRYCHAERSWYIYDGHHWKNDEDGRITRLAVETVRSMYWGSDAERKKNESGHTIREMIRLAQDIDGIPIHVYDFDRDPLKFNANNGTIHLQSESLMEHESEDLCRHLAPFDYGDSDAECPQWEKFVDEITGGDKELAIFLQRLVGYCMSGDTSEQVFVIFYGEGANGKSTFLNTICDILGSYAQQASSGTFTLKRSQSSSNDLARMNGKRLVLVSETESNAVLSETTIKQATGGEKITARFLYSEYFEFTPQFKIIMATNHKPVIRGSDEGIWRRVLLVPFTVTIAKEKQDRTLREKLLKEAPGILKWAALGYMDWKDNGLNPPDSVTRPTRDYRTEMSSISKFVAEYCVISESASVQSSNLYSCYVEWESSRGNDPVSQIELSKRIKSLGYHKKRKERGQFWIGIGLKELKNVA